MFTTLSAIMGTFFESGVEDAYFFKHAVGGRVWELTSRVAKLRGLTKFGMVKTNEAKG